MLTDVEVREAFHLHLLRLLVAAVRPGALTLKGGVNLRLYFRSPRYSEDLDLDGAPAARGLLTRALPKAIANPSLLRDLRQLGIRDVEFSGRPKKDTASTLRYTLQVVAQGDVALPTKVEVSLRARTANDITAVEEVAPHFARRYFGEATLPLKVDHYIRTAAVRQKLVALARRTEVQARDVFDLAVLARNASIHPSADSEPSPVRSDVDLPSLRGAVPEAELREAQQRATDIPYEEFRDRVVAFLDSAHVATEGSREAWDRQQLLTVDLIERILALPSPEAEPSSAAPSPEAGDATRTQKLASPPETSADEEGGR